MLEERRSIRYAFILLWNTHLSGCGGDSVQNHDDAGVDTLCVAISDTSNGKDAVVPISRPARGASSTPKAYPFSPPVRRSMHEITDKERLAAQERFLFGDTHFHAIHQKQQPHNTDQQHVPDQIADTAKVAASKNKGSTKAATPRRAAQERPSNKGRSPKQQSRRETYNDKGDEYNNEDYSADHDDNLPRRQSRSRTRTRSDSDSERSALINLFSGTAWLVILLGSYALVSLRSTSSVLLSILFPVFSLVGRVTTSAASSVYAFTKSCVLHSLKPVRLLLLAPVAYLLLGLYYIMLELPLAAFIVVGKELYPLYLFLGAAVTIGITLGTGAGVVLLLGSFVFNDSSAVEKQTLSSLGRGDDDDERGAKGMKINERGTRVEPSDVPARGEKGRAVGANSGNGSQQQKQKHRRRSSGRGKSVISQAIRELASVRRRSRAENGGFLDDDDVFARDVEDDQEAAFDVKLSARSGMWSEDSEFSSVDDVDDRAKDGKAHNSSARAAPGRPYKQQQQQPPRATSFFPNNVSARPYQQQPSGPGYSGNVSTATSASTSPPEKSPHAMQAGAWPAASPIQERLGGGAGSGGRLPTGATGRGGWIHEHP
ncbi:hypothetical protein K437DRAFT_271125 [Tilletiaria anomala UBC 951]|uniref:Transmembrane protein n=1 Tax=Tilletiaria anomala (strain ATCC 24038 / CBS 436.72 / UBC 951) TaxID=1037660 RepID=A0A066V881_TILAU|nr:uncharacterized protein K437DRAFT_271125 [Tilletiaria anomala UBC 951]KDN36493.1 hypothetical protein K437DRAFT_271125 [Tilletiaria anomala UBC 951]